ncbi:MAG: diguanylate cyclase [Bacteroidetes bacterium]|nr:diguanylate cyclase [Bacteroidota bacterium]
MEKSENQLLQQGIYQSLLANEHDAFIVIDNNTRIVVWNAAAELMFGHPREHAMGCYVHELLAPETVQERARDAFNFFRETGTGPLVNSVVEIDALHRDGHLFPVEISLTAHQINDAWFSQAIIRSIGRQKEVEAEMHRLATTDPLTGVYNRENMFGHGNREISRAIRYGHNLSVALFDIDQLKEINENSGHYAGDKVIQRLADFLKKNCRQSDVIGRLSGEEILVLLPETSVIVACTVAEKWREGIERLQINLDSEDIKFSCSIGVSALENEDKFSAILKKAEDNLEEAKALGGNTVVCRG